MIESIGGTANSEVMKAKIDGTPESEGDSHPTAFHLTCL